MYKRMDHLVAYITATDMFLFMPNKQPKHADIDKNKQQYEILMKCENATKEEFEALLKTKNCDEAFIESLYWARKR